MLDSWLDSVLKLIFTPFLEPRFWYVWLIFVAIAALILIYFGFTAIQSIKAVILLLIVPIVPSTVFATVALLNAIATILLDPGNFFVCLSILSLAWIYCRFRRNHFTEAVGETLRPWLVGMAIVAFVYIFAVEFLPRSEWPALFAMECAASNCEMLLGRLLPSSGYVNLGLFALLFGVSFLSPLAARWSGRIKKTIDRTKTVAAVLAVFTSSTFFGEAQSQHFKSATAEEKYARLKDQSDAAAKLGLGLRISENTDAEIANTTQFVNSVYLGVQVDIQNPVLDEEDWYPARGGSIDEQANEYVIYVVKERAARLREAMVKIQIYTQAKRIFNSVTVERMMGRPLTEAEKMKEKPCFKTGSIRSPPPQQRTESIPLPNFLKRLGRRTLQWRL